jgi:hypothetical protein
VFLGGDDQHGQDNPKLAKSALPEQDLDSFITSLKKGAALQAKISPLGVFKGPSGFHIPENSQF